MIYRHGQEAHGLRIRIPKRAHMPVGSAFGTVCKLALLAFHQHC